MKQVPFEIRFLLVVLKVLCGEKKILNMEDQALARKDLPTVFTVPRPRTCSE